MWCWIFAGREIAANLAHRRQRIPVHRRESFACDERLAMLASGSGQFGATSSASWFLFRLRRKSASKRPISLADHHCPMANRERRIERGEWLIRRDLEEAGADLAQRPSQRRTEPV